MLKFTYPRMLLTAVSSFALVSCATVLPETAPVTVEAPPVVEEVVEAVVEVPVAVSAFSVDGVAALEQAMGQYVADGRLYGIHTRLVHKGNVISDFKTGLRG